MELDKVMARRKTVAVREISRINSFDPPPVHEMPENERKLIARIWLRGEKATKLPSKKK